MITSKKRLNNYYKVESDGSGPPNIVAIKDFVNNLPCAIKIVELQVDQTAYPHLKSKRCPLFGFDFTRMGSVKVEYYGIVDANDKAGLKEILTRDFHYTNLNEFVDDFCQDFKTIGFFDPDNPKTVLTFFFYDPRDDMDQFIIDMTWEFILSLIQFVVAGSEVDYNQLY